MANRAEPFSASGVVLTADEADEVSGVVVKGFTSVTVHNGADATGTIVLHAPGPGTYSLNTPVECNQGVYVECGGAGSGSVLV